MIRILLCSLILNSAPALNTPIRAAIATQVVAQTVDTSLTVYAIRHGIGTEGNPLLPQSPARIVAVKALVAAGSVIAVLQLRRQHPRWALAASLLITASGTAASIHNARVIQRHGRRTDDH
jgi:hypothetical protein